MVLPEVFEHLAHLEPGVGGEYQLTDALAIMAAQGRLVAADADSGLALPDILPVAQAFGLPAVRLSGPEGLRERIRELLDMPGPVVCDVLLDQEVVLAPRVATAVSASGGMVSRPLEDLWPFLDRDELRENMLIPLLAD